LKDEHICAYFARFTQNEDSKAYIALDGERIIGYISAYIKQQADHWALKRLGEISGLMVAKDYRRGGIGQQLLERAIDFFAQRGVRYYSVYTAVSNQGAIDFYLGNGMEPRYTTLVGEIKGFDEKSR
jgi:ribosomal protein S18 acetylase RimI-like enzyme